MTQLAPEELGFGRLFRMIHEAVIVSDATDDHIVLWNDAAQEMFGYTYEEAVGMPVSTLVPPDQREAHRLGVERYRNTGTGKYIHGPRGRSSIELPALTKDGRIIAIELTLSEIKAQNELCSTYILAIIRDITEKRTLEALTQERHDELARIVEERTQALSDSEQRYRRLVGMLVASQQEERKKLSWQLHDGPTQTAVAAHMHTQASITRWMPREKERLRQGIISQEEYDEFHEGMYTLADLCRRMVRETRTVIDDLRPTILDDFGLAAALEAKVSQLRDEGLDISLSVSHPDVNLNQRASADLETVLYRVTLEALKNISKHAKANHIDITLTLVTKEDESTGACLVIQDDGVGFDPSGLVGDNQGPGERIGLNSMRERVSILGGHFRIDSTPGVGTTITVEIPFTEEEEE